MKKSSITKKVLMLAICCILACTAVFACLYIKLMNSDKKDNNAEILVDLNELEKTVDNSTSGNEEKYENNDIYDDIKIEIKSKLDALIVKIKDGDTDNYNDSKNIIIIFYLISLAFICIVFVVVYTVVLKPFKELENFASELSKGNLDIDLKYNRVNMFGEFTWAFDHMRSELKKSREREQEAVENNKTIIATLSHDIKTPVASIRAYAEGLSENMDSTPERRERYINVIMKKCDEVSKVTDDMFVHSLHDLDRLVINKDKIALDKVINKTIESLKGDRDDINVKGEIDEFTLNEGDSMRIAQVIENIITNARKYAEGSRIEVWSEIKEQDNTGESKVSGLGVDGSFAASYCLHIKDNGPGIPPEDLPFIFDKFYRGKNKSDKSGAGLGLFIVKYIMEAMGGKVELNNSRYGLEVMLTFYN